MSRGSGTVRPRSKRSPWELAAYLVLYWGIAVSSGETFWYGLAAFVTVLLAGWLIRERLIRGSDANRANSPGNAGNP
ncbi:MAG TPA: hypothetical protein VGW98_07740 [Solirubrobacteraceae bacterium]|jgi:hypothetical protein|nr:hypothetical protein [Solirubrobacteraceae bacterium]